MILEVSGSDPTRKGDLPLNMLCIAVNALCYEEDKQWNQIVLQQSDRVDEDRRSADEDENSDQDLEKSTDDIPEHSPAFESGGHVNGLEIMVDDYHHPQKNLSPQNKKKPEAKSRGAAQKHRNSVEILPEDDFVEDDSLDYNTMDLMEDVTWPLDTVNRLANPDFNVWRLGRDGMVDHMQYMYYDLGVTQAWRIPRITLRMFLLGVRERYQDNPYHNFKHSFCVTQMVYSMVCKLNLRDVLSVDDLGILLTAAVCHDVDHPGLSNGYHSHAHSPLAILYDYKSILEQHHFAVTCRILTNKERNIFRNVANRDDILSDTRSLILATDLALHREIMDDFTKRIKKFNFSNRSDVMSLMKIIVKCADVSNEVRPENIATPWIERLFSEYFEQSAREKRERLPLTPYMDPEKVDVIDSQEGFIKGMMLPMYSELANLIEDATIYYVNPLKDALRRYDLQKRQTM